MKSVPELSDLNNLQKQISGLYEYLNVTPVVIAKTYGMGVAMIPRGKDDSGQLQRIETQFQDDHIPFI